MFEDLGVQFLIAILPVSYLSAFAHELGHAVFARRAGFIVTSFGMGLGRPLLVFDWRGTKVYICRSHWAKGLTFVAPRHIYPPRAAWAWMLAGGTVFNLLLGGIFLLLSWQVSWAAGVWLAGVLLNMAHIANLVPFQTRWGGIPMITDGGLILTVLRSGWPEVSAGFLLARIRALRPLWEAIGDSLSLYMGLTAAGIAWVQLGDPERAERLFDEAKALSPLQPPFHLAYGALARGISAAASGDVPRSAALLDVAEQRFRDLGQEEGLFAVAWARSEARLKQGDAIGAADGLDSLEVHRVAAAIPSVSVAFLVSRLAARAAVGEAAPVETLRAHYERAAAGAASPVRDLQVYETLGAFYTRREESDKAREAHERALAAAVEVYAALADSDDQAAFLAQHEQLLLNVAAGRTDTGEVVDPDSLRGCFPPPGAAQREQAERSEARNRRHLRAGIVITGVNVVVALCILRLLVEAGYRPFWQRDPWVLLVAVLGAFGILAIVHIMLAFLGGRFFPEWGKRAGSWTLVLAIAPWPMWVLLLVGNPLK